MFVFVQKRVILNLIIRYLVMKVALATQATNIYFRVNHNGLGENTEYFSSKLTILEITIKGII